MVEIPDSLRAVFSATVRERDGTYVIELPSSEIDHDALIVNETYRVALFEAPTLTDTTTQESTQADHSQRDGHPPEPPVDEGEIREVTIETVGDQGDGIAKVERLSLVTFVDVQCVIPEKVYEEVVEAGSNTAIRTLAVLNAVSRTTSSRS